MPKPITPSSAVIPWANRTKPWQVPCSCIWCERDDGVFLGREHVVPADLGGKEELPRGVVCDRCNGGVLKSIDDALTDLPTIRFVKAMFGVRGRRRPVTKISKSLQYNRDAGEAHIRPDALPEGMSMDGPHRMPDGTDRFSVTVGGGDPIDLLRGVAKISFNAWLLGPSRAVAGYRHLRDYALGSAGVEHRPSCSTLGDSPRRPSTRVTSARRALGSASTPPTATSLR